MLHIAVTYGVYPTQMLIADDIKREPQPRVGGAFGDIFVGKREERTYAMKRPRIFSEMVESPTKVKQLQKVGCAISY